MISERQREEIRKEAKNILDNFAKSLEGVKVKKKDLKQDNKGYREEGEGMTGDAGFRKIMLENAPSVEGDFIIAEKKEW